MDQNHLHLLIDEEIYIIGKDAESTEEKVETSPGENLAVAEPEEEQSPPEEVKRGHIEETPTIPETPIEPEKEKVIPVAIFHESSSESEIELLKKIIEACKLTPDQYEVFANGFNKEVKFQKALVFVAKAKTFYTSIPYQGSQILCSKPLNEIASNQQEKVKLWGALKEYL